MNQINTKVYTYPYTSQTPPRYTTAAMLSKPQIYFTPLVQGIGPTTNIQKMEKKQFSVTEIQTQQYHYAAPCQYQSISAQLPQPHFGAENPFTTSAPYYAETTQYSYTGNGLEMQNIPLSGQQLQNHSGDQNILPSINSELQYSYEHNHMITAQPQQGQQLIDNIINWEPTPYYPQKTQYYYAQNGLEMQNISVSAQQLQNYSGVQNILPHTYPTLQYSPEYNHVLPVQSQLVQQLNGHNMSWDPTPYYPQKTQHYYAQNGLEMQNISISTQQLQSHSGDQNILPRINPELQSSSDHNHMITAQPQPMNKKKRNWKPKCSKCDKWHRNQCQNL